MSNLKENKNIKVLSKNLKDFDKIKKQKISKKSENLEKTKKIFKKNSEVSGIVANTPSKIGEVGDTSNSTRINGSCTFIQNILDLCTKEIKNIKPEVILISESILIVLLSFFQKKNGEDTFENKKYNKFLDSFRKTVTAIHKASLIDDDFEQTYVKYFHDYMLAEAFSDCERPKRNKLINENDKLYFSFIKRGILRIKTKRSKFLRFSYSLQKGIKRLWPFLGNKKRVEAIKEHIDDLTTPKGPVSNYINSHIKETVYEVFGGKIEELTSFLPTGSASVQFPRKVGGTLRAVTPFKPKIQAEKVISEQHQIELDFESWRRDNFYNNLEKINLTPSVQIVKKKITKKIGTGHYKSLLDYEEESTAYVPVTVYGCQKIDIVILDEASKFRTISKGDAYMNNSNIPLQSLLLSKWKRHPASTMLHDDLTIRVNSLLQNQLCSDYLTDFVYWKSGDFSKATDKLKADATMACIDALSHLNYPRWAIELMKISFTPSIAKYPEIRDKKGKVLIREQVIPVFEGQLMGHPLSFPLLCTINLACYYATCDRYISEILPKLPNVKDSKPIWIELKRNVIINGDDIVFRSNERFTKIWQDVITSVGFVESPGKSYFSPHTCMINSQVFTMTTPKVSLEVVSFFDWFNDKNKKPTKEDTKRYYEHTRNLKRDYYSDVLMKKEGYLNLKFIHKVREDKKNMKKGGQALKKGVTKIKPLEVSAGLNKMYSTCPEAKLLITLTLQEIGELPLRIKPNWNIPQHLGGYGIVDTKSRSIDDIYRQASSEHLKMATYFIQKPNEKLFKNITDKVIVPKSIERMTMTKRLIPYSEEYEYTEEEKHDIAQTNLSQNDDWMVRSMEMKRAATCFPEVEDGLETLDSRSARILYKKFKDMKIKVINRETFRKYWDVIDIKYPGPPPLPHQRLVPRNLSIRSVNRTAGKQMNFGSTFLNFKEHIDEPNPSKFVNDVLVDFPKDYSDSIILKHDATRKKQYSLEEMDEKHPTQQDREAHNNFLKYIKEHYNVNVVYTDQTHRQGRAITILEPKKTSSLRFGEFPDDLGTQPQNMPVVIKGNLNYN